MHTCHAIMRLYLIVIYYILFVSCRKGGTSLVSAAALEQGDAEDTFISIFSTQAWTEKYKGSPITWLMLQTVT